MLISTPLPTPFPVTFGPHEADWLMVIVTFLGALASAVVAVSALVTSRRAEATANASEEARKSAEEDREEWEYRLRFEDSLVTLMVDIGAYLERLGKARTAGVEAPSMDPLLASIEVVQLRARGDDKLTLDRARRAFSVAFQTEDNLGRRAVLANLLKQLRKVADGTLDVTAFEQWVTSIEEKIRKKT